MFGEMRREQVRPNVITYNTMLSACIKSNHWQPACQMFVDMKSEGLTPNLISYNALMIIGAKGRKWVQVLKLFTEMRQQMVMADSTSYSIAIRACVKMGLWSQAYELLREVRQNGVQADGMMYNATIGACAKEKKWELVCELYVEMNRLNLEPSIMTYQDAMRARENLGTNAAVHGSAAYAKKEEPRLSAFHPCYIRDTNNNTARKIEEYESSSRQSVGLLTHKYKEEEEVWSEEIKSISTNGKLSSFAAPLWVKYTDTFFDSAANNTRDGEPIQFHLEPFAA